jgi:predicted nucleic acid-binding protein
MSATSSSTRSFSERSASASFCSLAEDAEPVLERWFDAGVRHIACLPWEAETGLRWAELLATLRASGRAMPIKDSLIAATALAHNLIMATHNRTDFEKAGVQIVDPFAV